MRQPDSIVVTTFPADVVQDLQDFILWQPDATEIGVEATYVMVRSPRYTPGKVSGKGQQVGDGWLNTAGQFPARLRINCMGESLRALTRFVRRFGLRWGKILS
ncbi:MULTISPECIES: S-type pyocin domain-containing protein [Serratia]|uniref:S-type pyocin domain-containing protein n=1 Tax=Serratia TaxID=613 RepID=UPI00351A198C